ncbi:MAG: sulfatase-like hydrolase/transferase, partial [Gemmataceae bacterium]|nr:sulfatase-like hydrolase/transferase [Gemmataceae bacterium]
MEPVRPRRPAAFPAPSGAREFVAMLVLATLCYIDVWGSLIGASPLAQFLNETGPSALDIGIAALHTLALAAALWAAGRLVRRHARPWMRPAARLAFLCVLVVCAHSIHKFLGHTVSTVGLHTLLRVLGKPATALLGAATALALVAAAVRRPRWLSRSAVGLLFALSPVLLIVGGRAVWVAFRSGPRAVRQDRVSSPAPARGTAQAPRRRVAWILFDEWDQRLTFETSRDNRRLPQLDRFRAGALYADRALPPGCSTLVSIPSLLTGQVVSRLSPKSAADASLTLWGDGRSLNLSEAETVFDRARKLGARTAAVGWYFPYCRAAGRSLDVCAWSDFELPQDAVGARWSGMPRSLFESDGHSLFGQSQYALKHRSIISRTVEDAVAASGRADLELVFIHLPIPHPPFVYEAATGRMTLRNSPVTGYWDALELMDATLGRLRGAMERAGLWDSTAVILSSDH